jgi:hypothetical protein
MRERFVDSGLCLYYRGSHCTMSCPCPWGKSHINAHGKKECEIFGKIGEGHKLGTKHG